MFTYGLSVKDLVDSKTYVALEDDGCEIGKLKIV